MDVSLIITIAGDLKREKISKWLNESLFSKLPKNIEIILIEDSLKEDEQNEKNWRALLDVQIPYNLSIYKVNCSSPGGARNYGLKKSTGKWVAFWDFDDIPKPEVLFEELSYHKDETFDILIFGFEIVDYKKLTTIRTENPEKSTIVEIAFNPGIWRMLFRREIIENLEFPNLNMGEDQIFLCKIDWNEISIIKSSKIVYQYYVNQSNQLTNSSNIASQIRYAIDTLINELRKSRKIDEFQKVIFFHLTISFIKRINKSGREDALRSLYYLWLLVASKYRMPFRLITKLKKAI